MVVISLLFEDDKFKEVIQRQIKTLLLKRHLEFIIKQNFSDEIDFNKHYFYFIEIKKTKDIEIAKKVKQINDKANIVFVSDNNELVFDTLKIRPFYFIRKNQLENDLNIFKEEVIDYFNKNCYKLIIKQGGNEIALNVNSIIYIESYGHYCYIHSISGEYKTKINISKMAKKLQKHHIIRIHKSYLISTKNNPVNCF